MPFPLARWVFVFSVSVQELACIVSFFPYF